MASSVHSMNAMTERAVEVPVVYKRAVVMIRTLHAMLRSLPANRCTRAARRTQNTVEPGAYFLLPDSTRFAPSRLE